MRSWWQPHLLLFVRLEDLFLRFNDQSEFVRFTAQGKVRHHKIKIASRKRTYLFPCRTEAMSDRNAKMKRTDLRASCNYIPVREKPSSSASMGRCYRRDFLTSSGCRRPALAEHPGVIVHGVPPRSKALAERDNVTPPTWMLAHHRCETLRLGFDRRNRLTHEISRALSNDLRPSVQRADCPPMASQGIDHLFTGKIERVE